MPWSPCPRSLDQGGGCQYADAIALVLSIRHIACRFVASGLQGRFGIPKLGAMNTLNAHTLQQSWRAWWGSDPYPAGPAYLSHVWTFLFCCAVAVVFTVVGFASVAAGAGRNWTGWWHWYKINLIVALFIGFTIRGVFALGHLWLGADRIRKLQGFRRLAYFIAIPIWAWP